MSTPSDQQSKGPGDPPQRNRVAAILIVFSIVAITLYLGLDVWLMTRRAIEAPEPASETTEAQPQEQ